MAVTWTPLAIPSLLAIGVGWGLAWFIYRTQPRRWQNRFLAVAILLSAAFTGCVGTGRLLFPSLSSARAFYLVAQVALALSLGAYLLFLSTLPTPLVAWMRRPAAKMAAVSPFLAVASWSVVPGNLIQEAVFSEIVGTWVFVDSPAFGIVYFALLVPLVFGLFVTASVYRRARTPLSRSKGTWLLAAFGFRDIAFLFTVFLFGFFLYDPEVVWIVRTPFLLLPFIDIIFFVLLSYGILKAQLFDIDLRVKVGLKRSTVAVAFLGVFFVASQLVQNYTTATLGLVGGAFAAGLLLLALVPLQRMAERLADAAMPGVRDTAEYRTVRKRQVYLAAIESALADGEITDRERGILAALQDELGISAGLAHDLERQAHHPKLVA